HDKMMAEYHRQQEAESFHTQLDLMFIQGALLGGPKAPFIVQAGYAAYSGAETGRAIGSAINTGDPVDIGNAVVPIVGSVGFHGIVGGGPEAPPVEERPPVSNLEEVTPDQVRQLYRQEPDAVKKNLSNSFHQLVWERLGGQGPAPPAFRAGRVMQVNERLWTGDLSEINQPHELLEGGALPPDPFATDPTQPGALGGTLPGEQPAQAVPPPEPEQPAAPEPEVPAGGGGGTIPSAPAAPRPGPRRGPPPAVEVSVDDVGDAYRANPNTVFRSLSSDWHEQVYRLSGGRGEVPPLFRSGRTFFVDTTRVDAAE